MRKNVHIHESVTIDRRPDEVWAVVGDYGRDVEWRHGIREMTPDTPGLARLGTKVIEVLVMAGSTYTTQSVVTELGPGLHYRFAGHGDGGAVTGGRTVWTGPRPGTSIFTYDVAVEPEGIPRFLLPLMDRWMRRSFRRDLRALRALIEAQPVDLTAVPAQPVGAVQPAQAVEPRAAA
jgi:hypothetical protein